MTLEINARVNDNIPLVMQDTKSLKVIQKNKKRKVDGQICMVVLTYAARCHHPVGAPPVPASRDAGFFFSSAFFPRDNKKLSPSARAFCNRKAAVTVIFIKTRWNFHRRKQEVSV